ncbi:hypothetical protein [Tenuifilum thalassicum]|uniref:Uncharacterized protein n=1 Tax=Tenuifilum thalassicum TaxID=2590900 RepID=A0A7D4BK99_9BACT|nr:hypothetical protein [Tenuifilum thalassicum]QKG80059.1 hypothetical protein FHG85_07220 [Tenuifilum thalassicum]
MNKLTLFVTFLFLRLYIAAQVITNENNLLLLDGYLYGNIIEKPELERNNIYKRGSVLTFSYKFFDKNGKELFFYVNKDGSWDFIDVNTCKKNLVKGFQLEISKENMNFNDPVFIKPGYCIDIPIILNDAMTGLIENCKIYGFILRGSICFKF